MSCGHIPRKAQSQLKSACSTKKQRACCAVLATAYYHVHRKSAVVQTAQLLSNDLFYLKIVDLLLKERSQTTVGIASAALWRPERERSISAFSRTNCHGCPICFWRRSPLRYPQGDWICNYLWQVDCRTNIRERQSYSSCARTRKNLWMHINSSCKWLDSQFFPT